MGDRHETLVTFARREDGSIQSIRDVDGGLACNCVCMACQKPLVARQGQIRKWHFAHAAQQALECDWAAETALHFAMKALIERERCIHLPDLRVTEERTTSWGQLVRRTETLPAKSVPLDAVVLEYSVHPIRPDVVAVVGDRRLFIEVTVTHGVDRQKRQHIESIGASAIEFDLSAYERTVDWDALRRLLLNPAPEKTWLFHSRTSQIRARLLAEIGREIDALEAERALRMKFVPVEDSADVNRSDDKYWGNKQRDVVEGLEGRMNISGTAICFKLRDGGEIFVHSRPNDLVVLDITSEGLWLVPMLAKFSVSQMQPDAHVWGLHRKWRPQLFIFLNSLSSATRTIEKHGF
jgi:hypothetical protein